MPAPAQTPHPPIQVGGHGDTILSVAAAEADIVGFTGVTWRGDRLVPTGMTVEAIEDRVSFVRAAAGARADQLAFSALVQRVHTGAGREVVDELASHGLDPEALEDSPFFLVGPETRLTEKLLGLRERLGISYWVVFETSLDAIAPVVAALAGR